MRSNVRPGLQDLQDRSALSLRERLHLEQLSEPEDRVQRRPKLVADAREEIALRLVRAIGLLPGLAGLLLRRDPVRDVSDRGERDGSILRLDRAQADLRGELRAVGTTARQVEARTHRTRPGLAEVFRPMGRVKVPHIIGNQDLDRFTEQAVRFVAEDDFGLRVRHHDDAVAVHADHGVRGGVEHRLEDGLARNRRSRQPWLFHGLPQVGR